jgi:hypothetical protein
MKTNTNKRKQNHQQKRIIKYKQRTKINDRYKKLPTLYAYPIDVNTLTVFDEATNFQYSISQGIYDSEIFQTYSKLFQEFKIEYSYVYIIPKPYQGTHPPEAYTMILANEGMMIKFSEMPFLQGVTRVPGIGITQMIFKQTGRTDDLNRWYNTLSTKPDFNLEFHSTLPIGNRNTSPYYSVNVRSRILFRRPIALQTSKNTAEEKEGVKIVKSKQCEDTYEVGSEIIPVCGTVENNSIVISETN